MRWHLVPNAFPEHRAVPEAWSENRSGMESAELSGRHLAHVRLASTAERAVSGQDWPRGNPYNDRRTHLNRRAKGGG
jgi:hypothetical protein